MNDNDKWAKGCEEKGDHDRSYRTREQSCGEREREGKGKGKKGRGIDVHIHFDELNELLTVKNFNFGLVEIVFCAIEPGDTCIHTVLPTN